MKRGMFVVNQQNYLFIAGVCGDTVWIYAVDEDGDPTKRIVSVPYEEGFDEVARIAVDRIQAMEQKIEALAA